MKRIKYNVIGLVQGVGFRYFTYRNAIQLGIKGYVKNRFDGSVEGIAESDNLSIDRFINLLKQGPSRSRVEKVHISSEEIDTYSFEDFTIR